MIDTPEEIFVSLHVGKEFMQVFERFLFRNSIPSA